MKKQISLSKTERNAWLRNEAHCLHNKIIINQKTRILKGIAEIRWWKLINEGLFNKDPMNVLLWSN